MLFGSTAVRQTQEAAVFRESSLHSHQDANNFEDSANTPFASIALNSFQKDFNAFIAFFQMNIMCYRNRRFYISIVQQHSFQTSLLRVNEKSPLINNVCFTQFLKQVINVVAVAKRSIYCECCGQVQVSLSVKTYYYVFLKQVFFF